jgi:hypothetical protein
MNTGFTGLYIGLGLFALAAVFLYFFPTTPKAMSDEEFQRRLKEGHFDG